MHLVWFRGLRLSAQKRVRLRRGTRRIRGVVIWFWFLVHVYGLVGLSRFMTMSQWMTMSIQVRALAETVGAAKWSLGALAFWKSARIRWEFKNFLRGIHFNW